MTEYGKISIHTIGFFNLAKEKRKLILKQVRLRRLRVLERLKRQ